MLHAVVVLILSISWLDTYSTGARQVLYMKVHTSSTSTSSLRCVLTCPSPCFMLSGKHLHPSDRDVKWRPCVQESHHPCTFKNPGQGHCTIRIRVGGNPGVMVHLHTPISGRLLYCTASARIFRIEGGRLSWRKRRRRHPIELNLNLRPLKTIIHV